MNDTLDTFIDARDAIAFLEGYVGSDAGKATRAVAFLKSHRALQVTPDEAYLLLRALDFCLNPEREALDLREPQSEQQWKAIQARVLAICKSGSSDDGAKT